MGADESLAVQAIGALSGQFADFARGVQNDIGAVTREQQMFRRIDTTATTKLDHTLTNVADKLDRLSELQLAAGHRLAAVSKQMEGLSAQQSMLVETVDRVGSRVEMLEGATMALDANLRDVHQTISRRVGALEELCSALVHRITAIEVAGAMPHPAPAQRISVPLMFFLCFGASGISLVMQSLIAHL